MENNEQIRGLAEEAGVDTVYTDWRGEEQRVPEETIELVLRRLEEAGHPRIGSDRAMPAVVAKFHGEAAHVPLRFDSGPARLKIILEDGETRTLAEDIEGDRDIELPEDLPLGYHRLRLRMRGESLESTLIVAPQRCYEPPRLGAGDRLWGVSVQLYALRSGEDWGIGDFGELAGLVREAVALGADAIGLNPLHALYRDAPERCSPYGPASREFLNPLYIDVMAVADMAECEAVRERVASEQFQATLAALREHTHVDYTGVSRVKFDILRRLFAHFSREHLAKDTARAGEFLDWCRGRGDRLLHFATWEALRERAESEGRSGDWHQWPADYRDPASNAVRDFRRTARASIGFSMYLQWLAHTQLLAAQAEAESGGMAVGLYLDLALSTSADGAETWMDPDLFVEGMSLGAPPDALALKGQDWGLAPVSPLALCEAGMQPFRRLLTTSMSLCGAIRLDHVMSLMRLWWVPAGRQATDGVYITNPMRELLAVLTLESQRNECLVIGEDLGTVAPEIRAAMRDRGIYTYGVLYFEKDADGQFRPPADYGERCLVTVTTHDLPTLASYWENTDIELRRHLGLFPDQKTADHAAAARAWDRGALLYALRRENLLPEGMGTDPAAVPGMSRQLAVAVEAYLARSRARMLIVQPEDWLLMHEAVNVPGTSDENPNWRRRLPGDWRMLLASPEVLESCARINEERRR